jgi:hypothetical protein
VPGHIPILSNNDIITFHTDDPALMPLPSPVLLYIRSIVVRAASPQGAADVYPKLKSDPNLHGAAEVYPEFESESDPDLDDAIAGESTIDETSYDGPGPSVATHKNGKGIYNCHSIILMLTNVLQMFGNV